jgi:hypothetical protein
MSWVTVSNSTKSFAFGNDLHCKSLKLIWFTYFSNHTTRLSRYPSKICQNGTIMYFFWLPNGTLEERTCLKCNGVDSKSKRIYSTAPALLVYSQVKEVVCMIVPCCFTHWKKTNGCYREKVTRHQYYLQLKDNVLQYNHVYSEEKCFQQAAYALQADFGNFVLEKHNSGYFNPALYFPHWVCRYSYCMGL